MENTKIKATICPIEDGTCPTILNNLQSKQDVGHCGHDAHIIRAKYVKKPEVYLPTDPADANICDGCE